MKKNLVYIGNNLRRKDSNPTYMQALSLKLSEHGYCVFTASAKYNKALRLIDMLTVVWKQRKKTDYVIIDTYSTQNFYYALAVGKLCRILKLNYIPILHGGNLPRRLKKSPKLAQKYFNGAYVNISPSDYLKEAFARAGITGVRCIPNGLNLSEFKFIKRDSYSPKLFWLRSFAELYNPAMAVQAYAHLKKEYSKASLCMAGPAVDSSHEACKNMARELNLKVDFKGKLSRANWINFSKKYSIFINTSNFDNTPLSVIEAMALGLVVVSTNVGGMPYLINHNEDGLLVPANDSKAMAAAIGKILTDTSLAKNLVNNARTKALRFDWEKVIPLWDAVLK